MINQEKQNFRREENSRNSNSYNSRDSRTRDSNSLGGKTFFRAGQIFSIIYHVSLLVLLFILTQKGQAEIALKIFAINATIVICATLVSTVERVLFNKNRHNRGNFRRNNNHKKRRD